MLHYGGTNSIPKNGANSLAYYACTRTATGPCKLSHLTRRFILLSLPPLFRTLT